MKIKNLVLYSFLGAFLLSSSAFAHGVTLAKAAELGLHRIERLVYLKRINVSFQTVLKTLTVEAIAHEDEEQPSFKVTAFQHPAEDKTQKSIELIFNEEGRFLSHTVKEGGDAKQPPTWPDKDVTSLSEVALHYVLEGVYTKPELKPYSETFSSFDVSQGTNAVGDLVAVVDVRATANDPVLRIHVKPNGVFDSAEFLPKEQEKSE